MVTWCSVGFAKYLVLESAIPIGSTKKHMCKTTSGSLKKNIKGSAYDKASISSQCHGFYEKYYIYFSQHKTEIISNSDQLVWFVYENVNKRMTCLNMWCKKGDGTLKKIAYSKIDALIIADPTNAKVYEEDKKKEAAEAKRLEEEKEKAAALAGITTEEKEQIKMTSMVDKAKSTCKDLGFEEGTDRFVDCSFKLYTQKVELAAKNNQQIVVQGQSSGSNVMTIYDPVRDNNALIKRGQGLITGKCTLGDLSNC